MLFVVDEILMFMLCDRWFPGTLALVLLHVGMRCIFLFVFFCVCFVGFCCCFVDMASYSLLHLAGMNNRVPANRNGYCMGEEELRYRLFGFLFYKIKGLHEIISENIFAFKDQELVIFKNQQI